MSEEEKRENVYVRHQPDYRSKKLNCFIDKLEERSQRSFSPHARFERKIGTPLKVPPAKEISSWMVTSSEDISGYVSTEVTEQTIQTMNGSSSEDDANSDSAALNSDSAAVNSSADDSDTY